MRQIARQVMRQVVGQVMRQGLGQVVGHALTPYEKDGLVRFQRLGYTEELFVEALRCAVAADNRRMGYVLGILRNWHEQGVRCLQDVAAIRESWEDLRFLKRAKIG